MPAAKPSRIEQRKAALPAYPEGLSILSVCLDLHGHLSGGDSPWTPTEVANAVRFLEVCSETWEMAHPGSGAFDDAVWYLVQAVLAEARR